MVDRLIRLRGCHRAWARALAHVGVLVALALPASRVMAQAGAITGSSLSSGSVFTPPTGGGGGGQYTPPGDAGGPGGDGGPGGPPNPPGKSPDGADGSGTPPGAPPGPSGDQTGSRGEGSRSGTGPGQSATSGGLSGALPSGDTWTAWWEANKFEFIELRRAEDAVTTGQGTSREGPLQRELRLSRLRSTIRDQVAPVLRELIHSDDAAVRAAAIVSLAKLQGADTVDLASGMLADTNLEVRRSAILALGVFTSGRAAWTLMNIADDNKTGRSLVHSSPIPVDDRGTALLSATLRGDSAAEQMLVELLLDHKGVQPELVALAAGAAGLMNSSETLRPLITIAFDSSLPQYVRAAAASALGRIGDPSVTPVLMELLDQDIEARRAAIIALGHVAHPGATRVIERLAAVIEHDSDLTSRHFAAVSLGRIGGNEVLAALQAALDEAGDDLRPWVVLGLGLTERAAATGSVAPRLIEMLGENIATDTRGACLVALGLCAAEEGLPALRDELRDGTPELAGFAAMALGLSGQDAAEPALHEALASSTSPLILRQAALALGILGDTSAIPALLELIRTSNNPFIASHAAIGIAFMGDSNAAGPLLDLIRREGPTGVTTTYAVAALGQLFDQDRRPALSRLAAGDNHLARVTAVDALIGLGF